MDPQTEVYSVDSSLPPTPLLPRKFTLRDNSSLLKSSEGESVVIIKSPKAAVAAFGPQNYDSHSSRYYSNDLQFTQRMVQPRFENKANMTTRTKHIDTCRSGSDEG